jgi:hypothetical protein
MPQNGIVDHSGTLSLARALGCCYDFHVIAIVDQLLHLSAREDLLGSVNLRQDGIALRKNFAHGSFLLRTQIVDQPVLKDSQSRQEFGRVNGLAEDSLFISNFYGFINLP